VNGHDEADTFADELLFPGDSSVEIARARSQHDLILIAARIGIGVPTVAGRYAKLTGKWNIASRLREKITDDDVATLETLAGTAA